MVKKSRATVFHSACRVIKVAAVSTLLTLLNLFSPECALKSVFKKKKWKKKKKRFLDV
jgi:hypothetical protein